MPQGFNRSLRLPGWNLNVSQPSSGTCLTRNSLCWVSRRCILCSLVFSLKLKELKISGTLSLHTYLFSGTLSQKFQLPKAPQTLIVWRSFQRDWHIYLGPPSLWSGKCLQAEESQEYWRDHFICFPVSGGHNSAQRIIQWKQIFCIFCPTFLFTILVPVNFHIWKWKFLHPSCFLHC